MMDLQAAIGIHQLARVERNWLRRREIWNNYQQAFFGLPVRLPEEPAPDTRHAYHLFTVMVERGRCGVSRDEVLDRMNELRIGTGVHYLSVPEHPYYQQRFGWRPEEWPNALKIGRETLSLPLSPKLTAQDERLVVDALRAVIGGG